MNIKDAAAIAFIMHKQHGANAEQFVQNKIRHFETYTSGDAAAEAWRQVADALRHIAVARPTFTSGKLDHSHPH